MLSSHEFQEVVASAESHDARMSSAISFGKNCLQSYCYFTFLSTNDYCSVLNILCSLNFSGLKMGDR